MGGKEVEMSLMWNFAPMGSRGMRMYLKRDAGSRDNF